MNVIVEFKGDVQALSLDSEATGKDVLSRLNLKPDGTILTINGKPIPYTTTLKNGDQIRIIMVASGG